MSLLPIVEPPRPPSLKSFPDLGEIFRTSTVPTLIYIDPDTFSHQLSSMTLSSSWIENLVSDRNYRRSVFYNYGVQYYSNEYRIVIFVHRPQNPPQIPPLVAEQYNNLPLIFRITKDRSGLTNARTTTLSRLSEIVSELETDITQDRLHLFILLLLNAEAFKLPVKPTDLIVPIKENDLYISTATHPSIRLLVGETKRLEKYLRDRILTQI